MRRVSAASLHDPTARHMSRTQAGSPSSRSGRSISQLPGDTMCPMSARSIIHDGSSEGAFSSREGRRFNVTWSVTVLWKGACFLSCLHVVLGCFSGEMPPLSPQAGLILFHGIDETGLYGHDGLHSTDSIDGEPITVCFTQGIGLGSACTSGTHRYAGSHMQ